MPRGLPQASSDAARHRMESTRGRDTGCELALRSAVHRMGLRYRVDQAPITGLRRRADLVFRAARVAVFVDGCFWHGCPDHGTWPTANEGYWRPKIEANRRRDADTAMRLAEAGWEVLRFWEHEDPAAAAARVTQAVRHRPAAPADDRRGHTYSGEDAK